MPRKPAAIFSPCRSFRPIQDQALHLGGNFSKGVSKVETVRRRRQLQRCVASFADAEPGPSPPSSNGFDQSTITLPGSKSYLLPSPLHSLHAPYIELNENDRGSSCGTLMPHSGQASSRIKLLFAADHRDEDEAAGQLHGQCNGILQPLLDPRLSPAIDPRPLRWCGSCVCRAG